MYATNLPVFRLASYGKREVPETLWVEQLTNTRTCSVADQIFL